MASAKKLGQATSAAKQKSKGGYIDGCSRDRTPTSKVAGNFKTAPSCSGASNKAKGTIFKPM